MAATPRQENDLLIPNPPKDSISSISLNGTASVRSNLLVATSWDNSVSCYELQYSGTSIAGAIPRYQMKHDAPVLCSDFNTLVLISISISIERFRFKICLGQLHSLLRRL